MKLPGRMYHSPLDSSEFFTYAYLTPIWKCFSYFLVERLPSLGTVSSLGAFTGILFWFTNNSVSTPTMDISEFLLLSPDLPLVKLPNMGPPHPRGSKERLGKILQSTAVYYRWNGNVHHSMWPLRGLRLPWKGIRELLKVLLHEVQANDWQACNTWMRRKKRVWTEDMTY